VNWLRLVEAMGLGELAADSRFETNADRMENLGELRRILSERLSEASTEEWLGRLEAAAVPAGPVSSMLEALRHPQTVARDMVVSVSQGDRHAETLGMPVKMSEAPASVERGAPGMGEHTEAVLRECGYRAEEIAELRRVGAVGG